MAKKLKGMSETGKKSAGKTWVNVKNDTWRAVAAILLFAAAIVFTLASLGKAGFAGNVLYQWVELGLGLGYFLLPIACLMFGFSLFKSSFEGFPAVKTASSLIFITTGLGMIDIAFKDKGGVVGRIVATPLLKLFDTPASVILLSALFVISILIIFEAKLSLKPLLEWRQSRRESELSGEEKFTGGKENEGKEENSGEGDETAAMSDRDRSGKSREAETEIENKTSRKEPWSESGESPAFAAKRPDLSWRKIGKAFVPPPLSILENDKGKPVVGDINANKNIIKRTLQNFGINVEMDEISIGPSVTRYALKPAEGVKLSRIVALQNDLSLALAAHPIRIEAPIPGKSLVGIEIPNSTKSLVGLATMLGNEEFQTSDKPLLISLGKGVSGKSYFANLAKMPHLLIAGSTGSGKSVTIHTLITSLLFRNSLHDLKFIMIDPKRVELTLYNKIPHLLTPVITEAKKAILALKWAAKEMDRRYDILESESVRDIESYHKNILLPELKKLEKWAPEEADTAAKIPELMPYIVIVIDELADIMSTYPRELESAIVRLAQMSRAVGIHLILSTQRPSVNVITGLIKANIPGRIALQVSSQVDSRTILDSGGAEKLLGAGDMLFLGSEMSKPQRIQSAFVSESEVKKVVNYLKDSAGESIPSELRLTPEMVADKNAIFESGMDNDENGDIDDDLYEEAKQEVIRAGKASTSYIQRKLRVGYARAARLVDLLEERGVIGPADGAKPREVMRPEGGGGKETAEETPETHS